VISLSLLFSVRKTNIGFGLPLIKEQEKFIGGVLKNLTGARG
jgi:hypothetical protein